VAGVVNVLAGTLLLIRPARTAPVLVWVLGSYWFAQGLLILVSLFLDHSAWGWKLFMGLLGVLAGIAAVLQPIAGAVAISAVLVLLLGILGLVIGSTAIMMALLGGGWSAGILGALSMLFGLVLAMNYAKLATVLVFIWVAAVVAIAAGILQIVQAFRQRQATSA
jgi:uncharacterized membrane protein HdeD (DUF308 family)